MQNLRLQDWITIATPNSSGITQSAAGWLRVDAWEDLIIYTEVKSNSGTSPRLTYQTAPVRQDASFVSLVPGFVMTVGTRTDTVLAAYANVPVSTYVRWHLAGDAAINVTFRVWLAGNVVEGGAEPDPCCRQCAQGKHA